MRDWESFEKELPKFREMTNKFYEKEISVKEYKGFSGRYGSYAQRGGEASMLRLRMPGGQVDKEKLKFVADSIQEFGIDKVHLTTCQTIQLHNLNADTVCHLIEKAIPHHIITWGGGGDYPRNVMISPLTGVEQEEYFDVMPYAQAASEYLLEFIDRVTLPRKLKVCFSNTSKNMPHATFRDLGFVARPDYTFDVYSAGGLGNNPKMGVCVAEGISPSKTLYYIKAMIDTFMAYGDYENRGKARTRYMQDKLGAEGYARVYQEKLQKVMESEENLDLNVQPVEVSKKGNGTISDFRIVKQKQEGLYAVAYHPVGGNLAPERLGQIYEVIKDMKDVELRLSPDQSLYLINCTAKEAKEVLEVTKDSANNQFEGSVACIGASICQVGVCDSQEVMAALAEESRKHDFKDGVLPKIHISGCLSSCGTHQIGRIGFHGCVKMVDKTPVHAFQLFVNGCEEEGRERFGTPWGVIKKSDVPTFLMELGTVIEKAESTFEEWFPNHVEEMKNLARTYCITFTADN